MICVLMVWSGADLGAYETCRINKNALYGGWFRKLGDCDLGKRIRFPDF